MDYNNLAPGVPCHFPIGQSIGRRGKWEVATVTVYSEGSHWTGISNP